MHGTYEEEAVEKHVSIGAVTICSNVSMNRFDARRRGCSSTLPRRLPLLASGPCAAWHSPCRLPCVFPAPVA